MASNEENMALEDNSVRRTRSGREVKPPTPLVPKPARRTKKKTIVVEVEVSEDEDEPTNQGNQSDEPTKQDETDVEANKVDDKLQDVTETSNGSVLEITETPDPPIISESAETENKSPNLIEADVEAKTDVETETEISPLPATDERVEPTTKPVIIEESGEKQVSIENTVEKEETSNDLDKMETDTTEDKISTEETVEEVIKKIDMETPKNEERVEKSNEETITNKEVNTDLPTENKEQEEVEPMETEDISNEDIANPETEVISEDEFPTVQAVKVPETEEVSDDELPGPKLAELPADTEVVSEDELLPSVKKDTTTAGVKRKAEDETPAEDAKRPAIVETKEIEKEKEKTVEDEKESKVDKNEKDKVVEKVKDGKSKLPELDKYWKAVNDDPTDFTGWTYLLQYVDQVNDIEAAREAYDAFLSHYPYCYGYWRKYADYEKRKGNKKKCEEVFERGLKAIPLSVDLWLHFLNYTKTAYADSEDSIREQFERALSACGLEFRSDRLWDIYIKWETEGKRLQNVTAIYDRLLVTPTQGYTTHFDNFQEHVTTNSPSKILLPEELMQLRKELRLSGKTTPAAENPDIPPGEDEITEDAAISEEEAKRIKERIISLRRKVHKATIGAVTSRWNFEEGIKRPYFHVKPLERCQLKNWKEYLDFEIQLGDQSRIIILFERCLIACALYEEFWLRYVKYLEDQKSPNTREVYERACTVHHVGKPALHLSWAIYEEAQNNLTKSSEILINLEKSLPNLLQIAYRRINLERRRGDLEKCSQLYESYIQNSKYKIISASMAIKYARFTFKICQNFDKAVEIMKSAIQKDAANPRLYLQLIDLYLQRNQIDEKEILSVIDQFLEEATVEGADQKVLFAQRKLEFLEDFGSDIHTVQKAFEEYQKFCRMNKDKKKKEETKNDSAPVKKSRSDPQPPLPNQPSQYNYGGGNYGPNQTAYNNSQYSGQQSGYGGQYGGQYPPPQGGDQYQYQNWQYSQPGGYGGYNQWGGYGNYYQ